MLGISPFKFKLLDISAHVLPDYTCYHVVHLLQIFKLPTSKWQINRVQTTVCPPPQLL